MTITKQHLFIDLEETLIDNWDSANLGPRTKVWQLLGDHFLHTVNDAPLEATVWSFAVWDDHDKEHFDKRMRKWLEEVFNLKFVRVVTCKEMRDTIVELKGFNLGLDVSEMVQIWSKDRSLEDWVKFHLNDFANSRIVLLDDMVMNKTVRFEDANVEVRFVRV